ncbi:MAG: FAD-dependent thymidylate synthase [bacterium]
MNLPIVREPEVYLVGKQVVVQDEVQRFLGDNDLVWETDAERAAEMLPEMAGRLCYMSYGAGRKTNKEYLENILKAGHGSVLEHSVWNFLITNVSRSFTHELVRHRAGFGYSQLSQRYVDESDTVFVEPDCIAEDPELHAIWVETVQKSRDAYITLTAKLAEKFGNVESATLRRKMARQAARSVLPNATETKIFVTANARGLRNFLELRANEHAEVEIRKVADKIFTILQKEAPNIFSDYAEKKLDDGTVAVETVFRKV